MKTLSLWQPWATLLAHGVKRVETRGWSTTYRGPVLIHAAKKWTPALCGVAQQEPFRTALLAVAHAQGHTGAVGLPRGCVLGVADLVGCVRSELVAVDPEVTGWQRSDTGVVLVGQAEAAFGDFGPARYGWLFEGFKPLNSPIALSGSQGLFEVPEAIVARVREQTEEPAHV